MKIIKYPDPRLLQACDPVLEISESTKSTLDEMWEVMVAHGGMGLAANQVGVMLRMFVMAGVVGERINFINPKILNRSAVPAEKTEGCLSAPGEYLHLDERAQWVQVQYQDENGVENIKIFDGIHAVCVQHECVPASSRIVTPDGIKKIKDLYDSEYSGEILSFNEKKLIPEFKKVLIISANKNIDSKKWVKVAFSTTGPNIQLTCTEDHMCAYLDDPFDINLKYCPAMNLKDKYVIRDINLIRKRNKEIGLLNNNQISVIVGSILGDGCISSQGELLISHGNKNLEYAKYKQSILGGVIKRGYSGFRDEFSNHILHVPVNEQFKYFRKLLYIPKKNITPILKHIDAIALAHWYMDDGCLHLPTGRAIRARCQIHTEGFGFEELTILSNFIKNKFDLEFKLYRRKVRDKIKYILSLSKNDSEKFLYIIAPHVHESMFYKIPVEYRKTLIELNKERLPFSLKLVTEVRYIFLESKLYDIKVEDNSNFFANNTLVHNCDHLDGKTHIQSPSLSKTKRKELAKKWGLKNNEKDT